MEEIKLPQKIEITKAKDNRATLIIEPCFPGYGLTLGNALRRVLLSSLPGGAVTAVKVKGAEHEFSTLPYVLEDMVQIILNLKQLRFKIHTAEPVKLILNAKGKKKVKARDIKENSDVEIVNPDLHLATLTDEKAELEMGITVAQGRGYESVEERREKKREIGEIVVDAIFTPIRRVSYKVDNIRVGEMTNFDKLNIEIETDGTVTPKEALEQAAEILVDHFTLLSGLQERKEKTKKKVSKKKAKKVEKKEKRVKEPRVEDILIEDLKLSARTLNTLKKKRMKTIGDLTQRTEEQLLKLSGIGESMVKELKRVLGRKGVLLKQEQ